MGVSTEKECHMCAFILASNYLLPNHSLAWSPLPLSLSVTLGPSQVTASLVKSTRNYPITFIVIVIGLKPCEFEVVLLDVPGSFIVSWQATLSRFCVFEKPVTWYCVFVCENNLFDELTAST